MKSAVPIFVSDKIHLRIRKITSDKRNLTMAKRLIKLNDVTLNLCSQQQKVEI
jgi:tRNA1(Val) A37 N6-methylase TrmN6